MVKKVSHVEIVLNGETAQVFVEGKDIASDILSLQVNAGGGNVLPSLTVEYACYDQMTISGDVEIHHICPKGGRK